MSNVRVTYSGLISFVVGITSLLSGLFFTLTITRKLSAEEFGTWGLLGTIIGYFLISEAVISFWNYRQIARGENVGKSSVITSGIFSAVSIPVFLLIVYFTASQSNAILDALILGAILLPVQYISSTISRINLAHRPQVVSYGLVIFEFAKIPTAILLVVIFDLGIYGAIVALFAAYLIRISIQLYFAKPKLQNPFQFSTLKRWFRLSWVALYASSEKFFMTLDVFFYSIIVGSVVGVAFYTASLAIANIVSHAIAISTGLDAKLLATRDHGHIQENFILMAYFAIPLLGISIIFSKYLLFALNPLYEAASLIVIFLSIKVFLMSFRYFAQKILVSLETVDIDEKPKFWNLIKSKLFLVPSIDYISFITYAVSLFIVLSIFHSELSELELVQIWAILGLLFEIPIFITMWVIVSRNIKFSFSVSQIAKYALATIIFVVFFYFTADKIITYEISIFAFLPEVLLQLALCIGIYFGVTYLTDKNTRVLVKKISTKFLS